MKAMSTIGIFWFSLCLFCIVLFIVTSQFEAAAGWGMFGMLYAIPYSIVGLIKSNKREYR